MKRIRYTILSALAAILAFGCSEIDRPVFDPENATPPVLTKIVVKDQTLAEGQEYGQAEYTEADYGFKAAAKTALFADVNADFSKEKNIGEGANGIVVIKGEALNNVLVSAGITPGEETTIYFRLKSTLQGESSAVGGAAGILVSEPLSATAIGFDAAREYPKVWVLGSFNSWTHATAQFLYNYEEDEVKYQGIIDFGEDHAANEFKLTGVAGWDGPGNWGIGSASDPAEASSVELLDGSNDNITQYRAKRYYHFSFTKNNLILKTDFSFDQVGVIGLNNDWDNDIVMNYDAVSGRFWADVTAAEATEFKYRLDADWGTNWGGDLSALSNGGDNIKLDAGNYRIYLNLGNADAVKGSVSTDDYGTEISGPDLPPEPEVTVKGWSLIGDFNSWSGDVVMTNVAGRWTGYVNITEKGGFKIRKDGDWAEDRGGTMSAQAVEFPAEKGGANITVEPGFYKVVYDQVEETFWVSEEEVWSVIGDFNSWGGDVDMVRDADKWVCNAIRLTAGGIKIRHNHDWTLSVGGKMEALDTPFEAVSEGGDNIPVEDGVYSIVYDYTNQTLTLSKLEEYWALIGQVDGSNWDNDIILTKTGKHEWTCPEVLIEGGFKIRKNEDWGVNRGGTFGEFGVAFSVAQDGSNIECSAGRHSVVYDDDAETIVIR